MIGLYVHIPFCNHICSYCDFYKMVVSKQLQKKTIEYIIKEMDIRNISTYKFDTIYIGGGSPSSLDDELFDYFLFELSQRVDFSNLCEFTIEFNPEDITLKKVLLLNKYHISRVSIGIQSFNKRILKTLGRIPFVSRDELSQKILLLNNYGIININVDLIYAVGDEKIDELKEDLDTVLSQNITHLSSYSLILEEHTILNYQAKIGKYHPSDEELDERMYFLINDYCVQSGLKKYETSNYAKDGYKSRHNLLYWNNEDYLGIGPSASSHLNNLRFTNTDNLNLYFKGIDENKLIYKEYINDRKYDALEIAIMMGLRLSDGINISEFERKYGIKFFEFFQNAKNLIEEGLIIYDGNNVFIPHQYSYIANHIIVKFLT